MNKEKGAFFISISGCLISTTGSVSPEYYASLGWLSRRIQAGYMGDYPKIILCSRKDRSFMEALICLIGVPNFHFWSVIENGAAIFNPITKEVVLNPKFTPEKKKVFNKVIRKKRVPKILREYGSLSLRPENMVCITLEKNRDSVLATEELYKRIRKELADLIKARIIQVTCFDRAININPAGISKVSGIKFLAELEGIDLARSLGIGDSKHDIPFLRRVKLIGCPSNADDECKKFVKEKRGWVAHRSFACGVVDVIKYYSRED